MHILHSLLSELKVEFSHSKKAEERGPWLIYTKVFDHAGKQNQSKYQWRKMLLATST